MKFNIQINLTDELIDKIIENNSHILESDDPNDRRQVIEDITTFVSDLNSDEGLCDILELIDLFDN